MCIMKTSNAAGRTEGLIKDQDVAFTTRSALSPRGLAFSHVTSCSGKDSNPCAVSRRQLAAVSALLHLQLSAPLASATEAAVVPPVAPKLLEAKVMMRCTVSHGHHLKSITPLLPT
jgi:hypothetical protein